MRVLTPRLRFGYIEFESKQSIELALLLSGATVRGQPVIVQQSQAEKNRAAAQAAATAAAAAKDERRDKPVKIYVGNLPENTTEELLRKAFAKFGEIDSIQFHTEDDGRCKGYSFLTYATLPPLCSVTSSPDCLLYVLIHYSRCAQVPQAGRR